MTNECYAFGSYTLTHIFPYLVKYTSANDTWSAITLPRPVEDSSGPVDTNLINSAAYTNGILLLGSTIIDNVVQPVIYSYHTIANTFSDPTLLTLGSSVTEAIIRQAVCPSKLEVCYAIGSMSLNNGLTRPLLLSIAPNTMTIELKTIPLPFDSSGLILQSISCNSPSNSVCSIIAQKIIKGVTYPVSFTSFNAGETWEYNGTLALLAAAETAITFNQSVSQF